MRAASAGWTKLAMTVAVISTTPLSGTVRALANSVMVVIDPASNRPVPIPDVLREQLLRLSLK